MKASELRIGNFLLFENEAQEVSSIHSDNTIRLRKTKNDNCHGCYCLDAITIKAIPLTEDWLLKFGFESDGIEWWTGVLSLGIYKDGLYYCPTEDIHYRRGKEFKYVHQLQNLHHALTDEELIIKE